MLGSEVSRCSTNTTSNIENCAVGWQLRGVEQQLNEIGLSFLLGLRGLRLRGRPVAMMDVLAPGKTVDQQLVELRYLR
jgi:hypothetical protein